MKEYASTYANINNLLKLLLFVSLSISLNSRMYDYRVMNFDTTHKFNKNHTRFQEIKERLFEMNTTALIKSKGRIF